jgi:hypothetical protein
MESITTKEFLEKLKINNLKPAFVLKGLVKPSEKESEILFSQKQDILHWITIPASMIESVTVLKSLPNRYEPSAFVKLRLKSPSNPEANVLYELLMSMREDGRHECNCAMKVMKCTHPSFRTDSRRGHYCPCCGHNCSCGCSEVGGSEYMGMHKKSECENK